MGDSPGSDPAAHAAGPASDFHLVQMLPTFLFDVALPIVLYNLLVRQGLPVLWALVVSGLSPALNSLRVWLKTGRVEPLGIIVLAFLAIGTAASLVTGSVFFTLIKDSFLTGTFGLLCLVSLLARRPLMFAIVGQFVAGGDPARISWWDGLWQYAAVRSGMRFVTVVWGIAYLIEAFVRVGLALVLTPGQVVAISPVMGFGTMVLLIIWTRRHMLLVRERRLHEHAAGSGA